MLERENIGRLESAETIRPIPYVVSEDVRLLLQDWAERRGFSLPKPEFFEGLRSEFGFYMSRVFPGFELVPEVELKVGITERVRESGLFPVSLDKVYYRSVPSLEITRLVDEKGQDKGVGKRAGSLFLLAQFRQLRERGIREVVLVDDVIFTGNLIRRTGNLLGKIGIRVPIVCAGIGIAEGIEQLNGFGQEVSCVREYDEVIDEICERDFYPGVPMCGRSLEGDENIGVPYILPFGNPGKWASVPSEWQEPLSCFCLEQTIKLFEAIGETSGREIQCQDLERKVVGLPRDETRFVDALRNM